MAGVSEFSRIDHYAQMRPIRSSFAAFINRIVIPLDADRGVGPLTPDQLQEIGSLYIQHLKELGSFSQERPIHLEWVTEKALLKRISSELNGKSGQICKKAIEQVEKETPSNETILEAWKKIGRIVFLTDRLGDLFVSDADDPSMGPADLFNALFAREIKRLVKKVRDFWYQQGAFSIQDATYAYSFELARTLAEALVTKNGCLNLGLIDDLKEAFFLKAPKRPYEIVMTSVLEAIDSSWQPELDRIRLPMDRQMISNLLIRCELGLSPSTEIEETHAMQVALSALFSQFQDGSTQEAFTIAFQIHRLKPYLRQVLRDCASLIEQSAMIRKVDGTAQLFFFKPDLSDPSLDFPFEIDNQGHLPCRKPFWEAPGMKAALFQMGIVEIKESILFELLKGRNRGEITAREAISVFAKKDLSLQEVGLYAYSSERNRMVCAVEMAYSSLAETKGVNSIRKRLLDSVRLALAPHWHTVREGLPLLKVDASHRFQRQLERTLAERIHYVYNSSVGFELFEKDLNNRFSPGIRVATRIQFIEMMDRVVKSSGAGFGKTALLIQKMVKAEPFFSSILSLYNEAQKKAPMTLSDRLEPDAIDASFPFLPRFQSLQPRSPYDFINQLLKYAASRFIMKQQLPDFIPLLDCNQSLYLTMGEFRNFAASGFSSDFWLESRLISPCKAIADAIVTPTTKESILNNFLSNLAPPMMSEEEFADLKKLLTHFLTITLETPRSLTGFTQSLADMAIYLLDLEEDDIEEIYRLFDLALYESLPPEPQKIILEASPVFAKLGEQAPFFYYGIYYNVRTGLLGFARIDESRTKIYPVSEGEWSAIEANSAMEELDGFEEAVASDDSKDSLP